MIRFGFGELSRRSSSLEADQAGFQAGNMPDQTTDRVEQDAEDEADKHNDDPEVFKKPGKYGSDQIEDRPTPQELHRHEQVRNRAAAAGDQADAGDQTHSQIKTGQNVQDDS